MTKMNYPTTVGIIGGGQLGKMLILEGKKLGIRFVILDPQSDCPAASIADEFILANYDDASRLQQLAEKSQVITYEFEHIDSLLLEQLENTGHLIYPSPRTLTMVQDKLKQKLFLKENKIPVGDFQGIRCLSELKALIEKWGQPLLIKKQRGGYDGKGNLLLNEKITAEEAYEVMGADNEGLMVEKYIPFVKEISAIAARGTDGQIEIFPLAENIHQDNILHQTMVPARISSFTEAQAKKIAHEVMTILEGAGVFCIEMFVMADGSLLVNEIAPRTHNSGHYTIEGCRTSQFQQQLRAILGLPLGSTVLISPCVMVNLLGELNNYGPGQVTGLKEALTFPGVYLHYYGKTKTRPQRKMGHITILSDTLEEAQDLAENLKSRVKIIGAIEEE